MTWENTKPLVVFRSRMRTFNSFIGELYTPAFDGDLPQPDCGGPAWFRSFSPDELEDGLQPRLPGVPHLETLSRRHGRRRLDFRFQDRQVRNLTNIPPQDICPDVGAADNASNFISDRDSPQ